MPSAWRAQVGVCLVSNVEHSGLELVHFQGGQHVQLLEPEGRGVAVSLRLRQLQQQLSSLLVEVSLQGHY